VNLFSTQPLSLLARLFILKKQIKMTKEKFYKETEFEADSLASIGDYLGSRSDLNAASGRSLSSPDFIDYWNNQITVRVYDPTLKRISNERGFKGLKSKIKVIISSIDPRIFNDMVRNLEQITKSEFVLAN